jgi:hypothetical protein
MVCTRRDPAQSDDLLVPRAPEGPPGLCLADSPVPTVPGGGRPRLDGGTVSSRLAFNELRANDDRQ